MKGFSHHAKTLGVWTTTSTTFLNVIWICPRYLIWHRTLWALLAYANSSSKTNNCWLYKWNIQSNISTSHWMKTLMTLYAMFVKETILTSNGALPCHDKCWMKPSNGSIKWWAILARNFCAKHCSNAIITLNSDTPSTSSVANIAEDTSCLARDTDCYQKGKCE